jgi:glucans biosynthesis protein C
VLITVFHVIHMFRMPVFFMIAGYFGRMMLERRGSKDFIRDRAKRIVLPLIVGWPVVLMLTGVAVLLGMLASGRGVADLLRPPANAPEKPQYILMHFWFLYYLIFLYAGALVVRAALIRFDREQRLRRRLDGIVRFAMRGIWGPLLLAVPLFAVFALKGWGGHPGPPVLLLPDWGALALYGAVFGFGWLLQRQRDLILTLQNLWPVHIALAIGMTLISVWMVAAGRSGALLPTGNELLVNSTAFESHRALLLHAAAYTLGTCFWMFGLVGAAVRYLSSAGPVRRYLADSSYWLYLVHIPVLYFFQTFFAPFDWHWSIKYSLSIAGTMPILLVSYHYLVRPTFIGAVLNGRRRPRRLTAEPAVA